MVSVWNALTLFRQGCFDVNRNCRKGPPRHAGRRDAMIAALSGGSALAAGADTSPNAAGHTVKFQDGTIVPAIGQGSWHLGQGRHPAAVEEEALRLGVSLGMRLIDTAENYGDGRSEELISHAIAGQRDRVFLVSKVETNHVTGDSIARACESSLARLGTDYLDLYLLHWPVPSGQFPGVVLPSHYQFSITLHNYIHGARRTICRSWRILRSAATATSW